MSKIAATSLKSRPLAAIVDEYYAAREERYELQRKADKMKKSEEELKELIIESLRKSKGTTGVAGRLASAQLVKKEKVIVEDWDDVVKFVKKHNAFDLFQRRLSDEAVKVRWEQGVAIPGVNKLKLDDLSISKL